MAARWDDDALWAAPAAPVAAPAKPKAARWDDDALWAADFGNVESATATRTAPTGPFVGPPERDTNIPNRAQFRPVEITAPPDRTWGEAGLDRGLAVGRTALGMARGFVEEDAKKYPFPGARMLSQVGALAGRAGWDKAKAVSDWIEANVDRENFSDQLALKIQEMEGDAGAQQSDREKFNQQAMGEAWKGGIWETAKYLGSNPGQAAALGVDSIPYFAAGGGAGAGLKAAGATVKTATAGALGAEVGLTSMAAKQQAREEVLRMTAEELAEAPDFAGLEREHGPARARQILAERAGNVAAISQAVIGSATAGATSRLAAFEQAAAGAARQAGKGAWRAGAEGVAKESVQEGTQGAGEQLAQNIGVSGVDPTRGLTEGVGASALLEAAAGGPTGALAAFGRQPAAPTIRTGDPEVDTGAAAARRLIEAADNDAAARQPPPAAVPVPGLTQTQPAQPDALDDLLRAQEAITAEDAAREGQRAESPIPQPAPVFQDPDAGLDPADAGLPGPAADLPGPDAGPVVSVPDAGTAAPAAPEAPAARPRVRGAAGRAFTGAGESVDFDYAVVESDDLVPSNDAGGRVNARYPRELQPRDRTTPESRASVAVIAKNLNPERLGESQDIVNGAPLVGDDLVVESGNGRVMALQSADQDRQAGYRQWVEANAGRFGVDAEAVKGMRAPVLVRVRRGELDMEQRARLGREGNRATTLGMSPTEKAKADAALVTDDMMAAWAPSEDGDPLATSNQPFIRQFLSGLGANEAAELSSNGRLTKQAADRLQAAVFAKAYGDPRLINLFASEADPQIKNVLAALSRGAGAFARAKAKGAEDAGLDLSANLAEAAGLMLDAKDKGMSLRALLDQGEMFDAGRDPVSTGLALYFADNNRAPRRMGALIQEVGSLVEKELQARTSGDMFGREDASRADILDAAQAATAEQPARAPSLLSQGEAPGRGGGEGQPASAGRAAAGDAAGDGAAAGKVAPAQDISEELLSRYEADPEAVLAEYAALKDDKGKNATDGGRHIDTDLFRELSPAYRANRRLAGKIHRAASAITKDAFKRLLNGPVKEGRRAMVFVLGGGGGSGKSTATTKLRADLGADITLDGTLSNLKRAREDVAATLESRRDVTIGFVYRPPLDSLKGAIKRAAGRQNGRIVPTWAMAEAHAKAPAVVRALAKEYDGDGRVDVRVYDNSGKPEDVRRIRVDELPEVPSEQELKRQFDEYIEAEHNAGRLSDDLYQAFLEPKPAEEQPAAAGQLRPDVLRSTQARDRGRDRDAVANKTPPPGGVSASGPATTAAPATVTLDMPKMTASRLADLEIEVEASDGKQSKTVKVNAYKVLRRAMQRLDAINSLMECVRRG